MIKMKALRPFGVDGANEGRVRRGREFEVVNERRAKELESEELAYRVTMLSPEVENKMVVPLESNRAADAGPLGSVGGATGVARHVPSSRRGRPPKQHRLNSSEGDSQS
jgi:hypothetical protein